MTINVRADQLLALHRSTELLTLVNVWDVVSAEAVAAVDGVEALATAGHSIAASLGYPDGEVIGVHEMLDVVTRITAAVDLPVTADLDAGFGDPGETVRRAIGVGVVGANLEDAMRPLPESVAAVEAALAAAQAEGVPSFVLNARTDTFVRAGDRPRADVLADTLARGRAYLAAGAPVVFVPGVLTEVEITTIVEDWGPQRLSTIAAPGTVPLPRLAELGVARVSFGPFSQSVALMALQDLAAGAVAGQGLPDEFRPLN